MTYAATRSRAADMLDRHGQTITVNYVGDGTYDPATSSTSGTAQASASVKGAIVPLSTLAVRYSMKNTDGLIVAGDQELLLSALDTDGNTITAPQVNGSITDVSGRAWSIVGVEPLSPAGTVVLYDCVVRRTA